MKATRTHIINFLINKNSYASYLEIGVFKGQNFNKIKCKRKVGVDPEGVATFKGTSDEFFAVNKDFFDIIFIDGLHLEEQVDRDINNSLNNLSSGGTIVLHDCLPMSEEHQRDVYGSSGLWAGTVWKSIAKKRMNDPYLEIKVVDTDYGCGIIRKSKDIHKLYPKTNINYSLYDKYKKDLLNIITVKEFINFYG